MLPTRATTRVDGYDTSRSLTHALSHASHVSRDSVRLSNETCAIEIRHADERTQDRDHASDYYVVVLAFGGREHGTLVRAAVRSTSFVDHVVGRVGAVMKQRELLRACALGDDHARARRRVSPAAAHGRSRHRRASRRGSGGRHSRASASASGSGSSGVGYSTSVRIVTILSSALIRNAGRPHAAVRNGGGDDLVAGQRRSSRPA